MIKSEFFSNLHKIGYRYFDILKRGKKDKLIVKAFQSRYCPNRVSGNIDEITFQISHFLTKNQFLKLEAQYIITNMPDNWIVAILA